MNVIFITDSYYPKPSPNAICVEKLRKEFYRRGIHTSVIALRTFPKSVKVPADNDVHFVDPDLFYSSWYEAIEKNQKFKVKLLKLAFKLRGALYGFVWPLMSLTHLTRYKKKLNDLIKDDGDTIVIGTYKSLEAALSGANTHQLYKNTRFILYTLDAIANSNIPSIYGSKSVAKSSILRWEKKLFDAYDFIYLMKSHEQTYLTDRYAAYHNKMRFVDIPLLEMDSSASSLPSDSKKHLIFTGSISYSTANPSYFLKLIDYINDDNIVVDFYGKIYNQELLSQIKQSKSATYHGVLTHDKVSEVQSSAFALLNFGNFTPCGIPCKIFEYFSTGKPIVSCFKINNDASKPYMERYPNSLLIDERLTIKENSDKLKRFLSSTFSSDKRHIEQLFHNNTPSATVDSILSGINNGK